ncbi:MAG: aldehyde ferredoxin oxidoreductase family protein [Planctomycetes bacterium]|nr:aldehyde ferredoxin oxidoreductase family protein [Planctomycetota bacterium]
MANGFAGKILRIDLTAGSSKVEPLSDTILRRYLGGGLLGAYFLLRETPPGLDPYDPANPLMFMTSAMNGTPLSGANRYSAVAKSPLTGGFGESEAGGYFGPALKNAGFDGLIITGRAQRPVYLLVYDGQCEFRDAGRYWGRLSHEVQDGIEDELGDKRVVVLQTGVAGEKRVRFAAIVHNLKHWHGRCGLGAVMASKNLKAVAVGGKHRPQPADPETQKAVMQWFKESYDRKKDQMHLYGTARGVGMLQASGILPTRNFRDGAFDDFEKLTGQTMADTILTKRGTCYACAVACKREVAVPELGVDPKFGGPEYETIAATGSLNGVGDLKKIALANQLMSQYVLDSISTGVVVGFALEAYEKGLLTKDDVGFELEYGNPDVMVRLVEMIGKRDGVGDLLAEGVARAAKKLGPEAEAFALHVRGQELPMHEPRGKKSLAIAYATSPTGADHMEAPHDPIYEGFYAGKHALAPLGLIEPVDMLDLGPKKVRAFTYAQKLWSVYNVVGMCDFVGVPIGKLELEPLVRYFNSVTGWDMSLWEMAKAAERSSALFRLYNHREGLGTAHDTLPQRMFEPLEKGALKGHRIDPDQFQTALRDYYEMMGWDRATGLPTRAKLAELELDWAAEWV